MPDLTLDQTLHVAEIIAILGMVGTVVKLGTALAFRIGQMTQKFETLAFTTNTEIGELKKSVDVLGQLRINDASDRERMNAMDQRSIMQGQRIDEAVKILAARQDDLSRRIDEVRREVRPDRSRS